MSVQFDAPSPAELPRAAAPEAVGGPPGTVRVHVAGDVDRTGVADLRRALDAALAGPPRRVDVDLRDVTYFCTAAIVVLLAAGRVAPGRITLTGVGRPVRRLLQVLGLEGEFELRPAPRD